MASLLPLLPDLAEAAVRVFDLNPRSYRDCVGYISPGRCWVSRGSGAITWKIVQEARTVIIMAPDWAVWVDLDSTEEQWIVYSRGDLSSHEAEWHRLLDDTESPWHQIKPAFLADQHRRSSLLVNTRKPYPDTRSTTNRTHLAPRDDAPQPSSLVGPSSTMPVFGTSRYASKHGRTRTKTKPA